MKKLLVGIILLLVAVWGGPYMIEQFPPPHSVGFSSLITAFFMGFTGILLLIDCFTTNTNVKN